MTSYDLSMQYSHRELLASAVIGRSFAGDSKWLSQIVGGFTISDSTQSLTELQGVQRYEGREVPLTAPDVHEQSIRPGVTAGADFMRALGRALDANIMIRLHWLDRGPEPAFSRDRFPRPSARIILAGGGLRWGGRGKRP
jgi:hypothetical protein